MSPPRMSRSRSADAEDDMADPMKIRANITGDTTEVKVLMSHEMETGLRKDAQGKTIPAWFIQSVTATWNGKTVLGGAAAAPTLLAQNSAVDEIAKYRAALQDGNPAELWEARGEAIWKQKRGPKQVSFEQCDLGLGAGVVKGAYAQLPR